MPDLTTAYMGLVLKNPVIVASSTHTITVESVSALEAASASAVVLKSIFEEQVRADVAPDYEHLDGVMHPEAYEYARADLPMRIGPEKYLDRIRDIKAAVSIPVIASVNCVTPAGWTSYAEQIAAAGADALELNVYDVPDDPYTPAAAVEERHLDIVQSVKSALSIPVAVKIGPFYSSLPDFARKLASAGADSLVLFNRFFQPDIDTESLSLKSDVSLSRPSDIRLPLRWVAILRDLVPCSLSLTTGVHDSQGVIKALLAGADTAQVCSVLYEKGVSQLPKILDGLGQWMDQKGYKSLADFRGLMRERDLTDRKGFERAQYLKALVGLE